MALSSTYRSCDDADRWVRELFAGANEDWTPTGAREAIRVVFTPVHPSAEVTRHCRAVLCDLERSRAARLHNAEDQALYIQRRAFRRYCGALALGARRPLSHIDFAPGDDGRPLLLERPDIWFSFSACRRGMLAAWSATHAVGVDIEDRTQDVESTDIANSFFTPSEARLMASARGVDRQRMFFRLWCLKEAALKSIGQGLPFGLDRFSFDFEPDARLGRAPGGRVAREDFSVHLVEAEDACAAIVVRRLGTGRIQAALGREGGALQARLIRGSAVAGSVTCRTARSLGMRNSDGTHPVQSPEQAA